MDPIFFMHHANVDRLWWQWQNNGHLDEFPRNAGFGIGRDIGMWPWVDNPEDFSVLDNNMAPLLPVISGGSDITPAMVLNTRDANLDYDYA